MLVVFMAHDGDRAEERAGESVADRRKKDLLLLRHVIQQALQYGLQSVSEAFGRERMIAMASGK